MSILCSFNVRMWILTDRQEMLDKTRSKKLLVLCSERAVTLLHLCFVMILRRHT
jgi:hypothetical protein